MIILNNVLTNIVTVGLIKDSMVDIGVRAYVITSTKKESTL